MQDMTQKLMLAGAMALAYAGVVGFAEMVSDLLGRI